METKAGCNQKLAACRLELTRAIEAAEARATSWSKQRLAQVVEQHLTVPELIGHPGDPYSSLPDYLLRMKANTEHDFQLVSRKFEEMARRATKSDEATGELRAYAEGQVAILEERFPKLNESILAAVEVKHEAGQKALEELKSSIEAELAKHQEESVQLREVLASQQNVIQAHDHKIRRSVDQLDGRARSLNDDILALQKSLYQTKDSGTKVAGKLSQLQKELKRIEELKTRTRLQLLEPKKPKA